MPMPSIEYSIIIPAYNEEKLISATLTELKKVMSSIDAKGEIIVVDNNSSDRTAEIAKSFSAKVIFEKHNQISRARNSGVNQAEGKYFFFIDADTFVGVESIENALLLMRKNECCGGGALVSMDRDLGVLARFPVSLWNSISNAFSLAAGCFIFSRKDAFFEVGGFSEKVYASEEIWFSKKMKGWGKKHSMPFVILQNCRVLTSARKLDNPWIIISSTILSLLFPFSIFFRRLCFMWYKRTLK